MNTPDLTLVQKLGGAAMLLMTSAFGLLEAFGHGFTMQQTVALSGFATAFVSFALIADAVIRHGRSQVVAASVESGNPIPKAKKK